MLMANMSTLTKKNKISNNDVSFDLKILSYWVYLTFCFINNSHLQVTTLTICEGVWAAQI